MILVAPRNDGKNENALYIFVCCFAVMHFPPLLLERDRGEAQIAASPYDFTKPIMIVQAPRNNVRELNFKTSLREE